MPFLARMRELASGVRAMTHEGSMLAKNQARPELDPCAFAYEARLRVFVRLRTDKMSVTTDASRP